MELKKDENLKAANEVDTNIYQNANQSLFNGMDLDTPYQTTSIPTAKKSGGSDFVKYLVIGLVIVALAGVALNFYRNYRKLNQYNGTYEFVAGVDPVGGTTMTVEEMEQILGIKVYGRMEVKGSHCKIIIDCGDYKTNGSCEIKFVGNDIILTNNSNEKVKMYGTYDPVEEIITLKSGESTMTFEKVD